MNDFRFALRLLCRQPLLTAAAALTIAFGVGANTAIVSVLETALLNPLGIRHSKSVMVARVHIDKINMRNAEDSGAEFRDIQSMTDAFQNAAAIEGRWWTSQINGEAARLVGRAVTPEFFAVFSESPALGRFFNSEDRESVVLSDAFWRSAFGADRSVLGSVLMLDDKPYRIVGVAPPEFRFPANAQAWTPLTISPQRLVARGNNMTLLVLARLKDGVSAAQAADRVNRFVAGLKSTPDGQGLAKSGYGIDLDPFSEYVVGDLRRPLLLLWIAAIVVLLAGCANVAGLLLTRGARRRREMAIRISVGASRWQLVRQLMIESILLGALGGAAGLMMARGAVGLLTRISIPDGQLLALVSLDGKLLAYGIGLSLMSGLFFGIVPALHLLRDSQTADLARCGRRWFHDMFVTTQVAGAFVLVVATVMLMRSLWAVEQLRPGFDPHNLSTAFITKPKGDPGFLTRLQEGLRSSPGVESAALAYPAPFTGGGLTSSFQIQGRQRMPGEPEWHGEAYMISPHYFETLRIPLLRGRGVEESDSATAPIVCVIDAKLAALFFPNQDPIGQSIAMYKGWARIVGVAGAIRGTTLETGSRPIVYYSLPQVPFFAQIVAIVRSRVAAGSAIRQAVRGTSRNAPVFDIKTMDDRIAESLGIRRLVVTLLAVFGGISLLLASIGLYGVIAQVVGERTQEIGIRMALGARPGQILAYFLGQGLRSGLIGVAIGTVAAVYGQRWLSGMLYEVGAQDPWTFAATGAAILVILSASVWWPAQRAARLHPQAALRHSR